MLKELARATNSVLRHAGLKLVRRHRLYPWQLEEEGGGKLAGVQIPTGAAEHLTYNNPCLVDLIERYRRFDRAVTDSLIWSDDTLSSSDLIHFRADNAFVWQLRGLNYNELTYALSYYALKCGPASDLLAVMSEDGLFGVHTFEIDGRLVSRDLIDSVREVDFIRTHVGLNGRKILDIGAGYGRLAHRLAEADPGVTVYATDAFAPSTFLAAYYLQFRAARQARAVPIDELGQLLRANSIDLATNVHSFSECTPQAVAWWGRTLAQAKVPRLMVIPNGEFFELAGPCRYSGGGVDMEETLNGCGYRPVVRELRYADPAVQKYAVDPAQIVLFELQ